MASIDHQLLHDELESDDKRLSASGGPWSKDMHPTMRLAAIGILRGVRSDVLAETLGVSSRTIDSYKRRFLEEADLAPAFVFAATAIQEKTSCLAQSALGILMERLYARITGDSEYEMTKADFAILALAMKPMATVGSVTATRKDKDGNVEKIKVSGSPLVDARRAAQAAAGGGFADVFRGTMGRHPRREDSTRSGDHAERQGDSSAGSEPIEANISG